MIGLIKKDIYLILKTLVRYICLLFNSNHPSNSESGDALSHAIFPVSYDSFYADRSYNGS